MTRGDKDLPHLLHLPSIFRCCQGPRTVLGADRNRSDVMISKGGDIASGLESRSSDYHEKNQSDMKS